MGKNRRFLLLTVGFRLRSRSESHAPDNFIGLSGKKVCDPPALAGLHSYGINWNIDDVAGQLKNRTFGLGLCQPTASCLAWMR